MMQVFRVMKAVSKEKTKDFRIKFLELVIL